MLKPLLKKALRKAGLLSQIQAHRFLSRETRKCKIPLSESRVVISNFVLRADNTAEPPTTCKAYLDTLNGNTKSFSKGEYFIYPYDPTLFVYHEFPDDSVLFGNTTPRFDFYVDNGFCSGPAFHDAEPLFIEVARYVEQRKTAIMRSLGTHKAKNWLQRVPTKRAENLGEALQSILFINGLVWQQGTTLIGLGRVDKYLSRFSDEIRSNRDNAKALFHDFLLLLHKDYIRKSNVLLGDTGQVIVLGGQDLEGGNVITEIILETLHELHTPDPKVVFRYSGMENPKIRELIFRCIEEGLGYPLLLNEEAIQQMLIQFGHETNDVQDFVVAACWEPILPRKGFEIVNVLDFNFMDILLDCLNRETQRACFSDFLEDYIQSVKHQALTDSEKAKSRQIAFDPVLYSFFKIPFVTEKAQSKETLLGSPGILSVGLVNAVDALFAIKHLVFDKKLFTLNDFRPDRITDGLMKIIANTPMFFGKDDPEVIFVIDRIIHEAASTFKQEGVKLGLASPSDLRIGERTPRTPDGREAQKPLAHHLIPNRGNFSLSETFSFLSKIPAYKKAFNGSTVEITLTKDMATNLDVQNIILEGIKSYVYSMQINVLDVEELEAALENPENYPNLIVRVWGFSAYFKDLPRDYQQLLVERARRNANH